MFKQVGNAEVVKEASKPLVQVFSLSVLTLLLMKGAKEDSFVNRLDGEVQQETGGGKSDISHLLV